MKTNNHPTHALGPWEVSARQRAQAVEAYPVEYFAISGHGQAIGRVYAGSFANVQANASLVASAPDLLVALKRLVQCLDDNGDGEAFSVVLPAVRNTINRAEGR